MNLRPMPIELTDGLIERMLVLRAGRRAPGDLVASVIAATDRTSQRRQTILALLPVPTTARMRLAWFAFAVALALLAIGIALVGAALLHRPGPFGLGLATFVSNGDIFVEYADGTGRRQLTSSQAFDFSPAFSPDGSTIAYLSQAGPGDQGDGPSKTAPTSLLVVRVDGSGERVLVDGLLYVFSVAWSPDSAHIAYRHEVPAASGSGTAIGVVGLDGSPPVTLLVDGDEPRWSPDGQQIAYTSGQAIHLVASDGTGDRPLVLGADPLWSPDSLRVAFSRDVCCGLLPDPWVVDRDGSNEHPLGHQTGDEAFGGWSSDGQSTVINRVLADGTTEITIADAEGSNARVLSVPGVHAGAGWAPDGSRLLVASASGILLVDPSGSAAPIVIPIDSALALNWQPVPAGQGARPAIGSASPARSVSAAPIPPPRRSANGFSVPLTFDPTRLARGWSAWSVSPHAYEILHMMGPDFGLAVYADARLYADPCHPSRGFADTGSTPGSLTAALANVPGFAIDKSEPITLDGHRGVRVSFRTTTDASDCDPRGALTLLHVDPKVDELFTYPDFSDDTQGGSYGCCSLNHRRSGSVTGGQNGTALGSVAVSWLVLDVNGTRLILEAWTAVLPNGSQIGSTVELQEVLDTVRFE